MRSIYPRFSEPSKSPHVWGDFDDSLFSYYLSKKPRSNGNFDYFRNFLKFVKGLMLFKLINTKKVALNLFFGNDGAEEKSTQLVKSKYRD